jgi:DNA-binding LacI/PurR family transcriptional regulator
MSIVQVAKHAGVFTAMVLRVLNPVPSVGESTARKVRAAMDARNHEAVEETV